MKTMRFSCEQIHFLGVSTQIAWNQEATEPMKVWKEFYQDGTMERLLKVCQANKVYGLYCYDSDMENQTVTYHIVCENRAGAVSEEFTSIDIEPSHYIVFEQKGTNPLEREKEHETLCEEVFKEWLPSSGYEALTDPFLHKCTKGLAIIESVTPVEPESTNYTIELWLPVKKQ